MLGHQCRLVSSVRIACAALLAAIAIGASPASAAPTRSGANAGATSGTSSKPKPTTQAAQTKARKPVDYKKGRPPPAPATRLPGGAVGQAEDAAARRQIVGDRLPEDQRAKASDPELSALRNADRVLFARPLAGFKPGWSWGTTDSSVQADGLPPSIEAMPSATVSEAKDSEWLRSLALPDFPMRLDPLVVEYLRFYRDTDQGRAIAQVWARKVGRYTAAMQEKLAAVNLPRDLVWLSLIESGHNPTILSPAGAAGMWQFIPDSARLYGLTVDRWVDERLDPERATEAAARYLGDLYTRFGTWELAMAAYNMGHAGLLKTLRKYNSNDYWKLVHYEAALPWETILYVPKVIAIAIVMNNRRAFGLDEIALDPAVTFDTVYVAKGTPWDVVAKASGVAVEALRSMNPQYLGDRLPLAAPGTQSPSGLASALTLPVAAATPDSDSVADKDDVNPSATVMQGVQRWPVRVPVGSGSKTARLLVEAQYQPSYDSYMVRFGDTLESVATHFQLTTERLAQMNGLLEGAAIRAGTVLLVPRAFAGGLELDSEEVVVVPTLRKAVAGRNRVFYRVLRGDSLLSIASALGVTLDELVVWNELEPKAKLQAGMTLQAFVPARADLARVRTVNPQQAKLLEVGTRDFLTYFEALNGRKRITVRSQTGDTLEKIGKRHGLSVGMMERINRCSRTRVLKPGEEIIVYSKTEAAKADSASKPSADQSPSSGRPLASIEPPRPDLLPARNQ